MPSVPPPAEAALRARVAELEAANAALREAAAARDELAAAQLAARDAQLAVLAARVEELERRLGKDSSTSSKPPSSDSPYKKKSRDRSLRGRSGRAPGKQPGAPSSTLKQSADPGETVKCGPAACGCCGADLADAEVTGVQKRQVFEASPPPPPAVIEYQVQAKTCGNCGTVSIGLAPAHVTGRVQYGPGVHARAALAVCAHYLPAGRAAALVASLAGVKVSAGFVAGVRGRAAARLDPFMDRVRGLLRDAAVLYADETRSWYRGAVAKGIADNQGRRSRAGKDGLRLARRFRDHQDMILRFTTDLAVGFTSNQAERDVRPVKVQMRTSGGCWRTLEGLTDFAVVQSYLSTAAKWGIDQLDALTQLFTDGPWLPGAIRPG